MVAPNTRDARFETGHRQNFIYLLNNKTIEKTKIKEEAGNGPSKKIEPGTQDEQHPTLQRLEPVDNPSSLTLLKRVFIQ